MTCAGVARFGSGSFAGVLVLTLIAAGCARTRRLPATADGDRAAAGTSAAPAFDRRFDVVEEFAEQCATKCGGVRPPSTIVCLSPPIETCTDACALALRNVERRCAECIAATLVWQPGREWCNDFECGCDHLQSGPRFGDCTAECAASREYQRQLREDAPRPADVGRAPAARTPVDGEPLHELEPAPEGLFALRREPSELAVLSRAGAPRWSVSLLGVSARAPALLSNGSRALLRPAPSSTRWLVFDAGGLSHELDTTEFLEPGTSLPEGFVGVARGEIQRFSVEGQLVSSETLPESLAYLGGLVELRAGGYAVVAHAALYGPSTLAQLGAGDAGEALSIAWQLELGASVTSLVETPGGALFFAALATPRMDGCCSSEREALFGLVSAGGELQWTWQPDSLDARARAPQVFAVGDVLYAVATEDPASRFASGQRYFTPSPQQDDPHAGRCSVYGCAGVAVRRFARDGALVWDYQLRSETSTAQDAALVGRELFVLATLHGEEPQQVMLRFEP